MKTSYLLGFLWLLWSLGAHAQDKRVPLDESKVQGHAEHSEMMTSPCLGEIHTPSTDLKWRAVVVPKRVAFRPQNEDDARLKAIKAEKSRLKLQSMAANAETASASKTNVLTPVVGTNFAGNLNNGYSPLDNSIAVSRDGIIVSVANNTIEIDHVNGTNLYYNDIATFFNDATIANVCDPVAFYDNQADRFIFFAQECSGSSSNSHLLICFSKSNDPANDGWWKYKFDGDPLNRGTWFDYPKLGISNDNLFITGNQFFNGGGYDQSLIYQFNKQAGYSGGSVNWMYWHSISGNPFTLLPVSQGQGLAFGPGCYFVATSSSGSSEIKLYDLTDDLSGSPTINYYTVATTAYSASGDAYQLGTTCQLSNGDCRALSGFYLNGVIHFVFHSDIGDGWNGINYNRLTLNTLSNQSSMFGFQGSYDYSYPSVASVGTSLSDGSVIIGFGRASSAIYPQVRVVSCDDAMNWSSSFLVKSGLDYVSQVSSVMDRWGDYTGAARMHGAATPTVWLSGMYGNAQNKWDTWLAEITASNIVAVEEAQAPDANADLKVYPNPVISTFSVEFELAAKAEIDIQIHDASGKLIVKLFSGTAPKGLNVFSFNQAQLAAGTYFLSIRQGSNILKHEKIIVAE